ncbi:MAG TPA: hypothetical protein VFB45_10395 [Pseudolabrys sp.]|nr:hypothetical protein [Pseudolabrys sp.]
MWSFLANLIGGPIVTGLIGAYKAKLAAGNTSEKIAADLAARELAVEQRERELNTQVVIAEEGRWWTALPRTLVCYAFALYVVKAVVVDCVLGLGSTAPLRGDLAVWAGWLMALWFGGRSLEKIARIIKR